MCNYWLLRLINAPNVCVPTGATSSSQIFTFSFSNDRHCKILSEFNTSRKLTKSDHHSSARTAKNVFQVDRSAIYEE